MITFQKLMLVFAEVERAGQSRTGLALDEGLTATLCDFLGQHGDARSLVRAIQPDAYATYSGGGYMEDTTHEIVARVEGKATRIGAGPTADAAWADALRRIAAEEDSRAR